MYVVHHSLYSKQWPQKIAELTATVLPISRAFLDAAAAGAYRIAERLRAAIAQSVVSVSHPGRPGACSHSDVSIGIATLDSGTCRTVTDMLAAAAHRAVPGEGCRPAGCGRPVQRRGASGRYVPDCIFTWCGSQPQVRAADPPPQLARTRKARIVSRVQRRPRLGAEVSAHGGQPLVNRRQLADRVNPHHRELDPQAASVDPRDPDWAVNDVPRRVVHDRRQQKTPRQALGEDGVWLPTVGDHAQPDVVMPGAWTQDCHGYATQRSARKPRLARSTPR
jgi:hypothetical protein